MATGFRDATGTYHRHRQIAASRRSVGGFASPEVSGARLTGGPDGVGRTLIGVWQIALLGPLEVRRDGLRLPVPSGKASELLVRLCRLRGVRCPGGPARRRSVGSSRGDHSTQHAAVEGGYAPPGAWGSAVIRSRDGGYALAVEPLEVDALAVMANVAAASGLLDAATTAVPLTCVLRPLSFTAGRYFRLPAMGIGSIRTEPGSRRPA